MHIVPSIKGRTSLGRWYKKTRRISIFINRIWNLVGEYKEVFDEKKSNPKLKFPEMKCFMAHFLSTEFHEIVHILIDRWEIKGQPCRTSKCEKGECFWCEYTFKLENFFLGRGIDI